MSNIFVCRDLTAEGDSCGHFVVGRHLPEDEDPDCPWRWESWGWGSTEAEAWAMANRKGAGRGRLVFEEWRPRLSEDVG